MIKLPFYAIGLALICLVSFATVAEAKYRGSYGGGFRTYRSSPSYKPSHRNTTPHKQTAPKQRQTQAKKPQPKKQAEPKKQSTVTAQSATVRSTPTPSSGGFFTPNFWMWAWMFTMLSSDDKPPQEVPVK